MLYVQIGILVSLHLGQIHLMTTGKARIPYEYGNVFHRLSKLQNADNIARFDISSNPEAIFVINKFFDSF